MLLRPCTVHDSGDVERSGVMAASDGHAQLVARRLRLDRVDAAAHDLELTARDRTLYLAVDARRHAMAMRIPERAHVAEEAASLRDRPVAPERGSDAPQLGECAPPLVAARIFRSQLANVAHDLAQG